MRIMIVGATSAIAHETAKFFARDGVEFFLVARSAEKLEDIGNDLKVRGAKRIETFVLDVTDLDRHQEMVETAITTLDGLDMVLIAYGTLANQQKCQRSVAETLKEFTTNCTSVISLLTILADYFERQRRGCIAVISSVAGDRGRPSNYVYGAAKSAVSTFLQGLRSRLHKSGVAVVTIKPGFVDTDLTKGMPGLFWLISPDQAAAKILAAARRGSVTAYVPARWRLVGLVIRSIPSFLFRRLKI